MKVLFLFIMFQVILVFPVRAGNDFQSVEAMTYRLYTEKKWDSLIMIGRQALREGHDYYYLRLRLGIAYYNKQKYIQASDHLSCARTFNSADPLVLDYLYSSYLLGNRAEEARHLAASVPVIRQKEMGYKRKILEKAAFEGGITLSGNNKLEKHPDIFGADSLFGEKDVYGNSWYGNTRFTFNLAPALSFTVGYTYLDFLKYKYFQYSRLEDHLDSTTYYSWGYMNHYSYDNKVYNHSYKYHVNQQQLFMGVNILLPEGFKLKPAFHLLRVKYRNAEIAVRTVYDTIIADTISSEYTIYSFVQPGKNFITSDTSFYNYVVSLLISKDFSIFTSSLSASYSNLNGKGQVQLGWALTYYPLGNLNLYGSTSLLGFFEEGDSRLIFSQMLGGKIFPWLWLEGSALVGDLTNANLFNGAVVYNNSDRINYLLGANAVVILSHHLQLSFSYQFSAKESATYYYTYDSEGMEPGPVLKNTSSKYNTHSITGGLTWKL